MSHALLFDLDDTLIFESEFQASAISAVKRHLTDRLGFLPADVELAVKRSGPPGSMDRYQRILAALGEEADRGTVEELIRVHRSHKPTLSWQPDVPRMLKELSCYNVKLGIVTDGLAETQRGKLSAVDAESVFDCIIVTDELGEGRRHWKPDTKPFHLACERLGVPLSRAIYVGDNPEKDFYMTTLIPITTVRLFREGAVYLDSPYRGDVREHFRIRELGELPMLLDRLGVGRR